MKHKQNGFSPLLIIFVFLIIGIVGVVGWRVFQQDAEADRSQQQPPAKQQAVLKDKQPVKETTATLPEGWTSFSDSRSGISFYHPGQWANEDMRIDMVPVGEAIVSGYGTPDSVAYDSSAKKWEMYLNHGEAAQQKIDIDATDEYAFKEATITKSLHPAVYKRSGHASVVTHDIYLIANEKAVRIRLPMINSFDDQDWEDKLSEQVQALPEIFKSISFQPHTR